MKTLHDAVIFGGQFSESGPVAIIGLPHVDGHLHRTTQRGMVDARGEARDDALLLEPLYARSRGVGREAHQPTKLSVRQSSVALQRMEDITVNCIDYYVFHCDSIATAGQTVPHTGVLPT